MATASAKADLVERARAGDHTAFAILAEAAFGRMYGAAKLILRDQYRAEDAVQEALLLAWRHIAAIRAPDAWDVWLYRLTVRVCYRLARPGRDRPLVALDLQPDREAPGSDFTKSVVERDGEQLGVPTIAGDLVWAGPGEDVKVGGLSALRLADGARIWHLDEPLAAPVVSGDTAVTTAASTIGVVTGRVAATGAERWRFGPGGYFLQVAIAGDVAYVLSHTQRQVYGLDVGSGRVLWQVPLDAEPGCCLGVARGTLVVATSSGTVTAYGDGEPDAGPTTSSAILRAAPAATAVHSAAPSTPRPANPIPFPLSVTSRFDPASLGLKRPISVGMAANGDFYVTDSLHRVSQYGPDGLLVRRWGSPGDGPGEFDFGPVTSAIGPRGPLAVGSDGLVYVSDVENHRVQVFAPDGGVPALRRVAGAGPGQFTIPFDLTADAAGNVYVTDDGAQRITKFSPSGAVLWIADQTTDARLVGHAHTPSFDGAGSLVVTIDDSSTIVHLDPATGRVTGATGGGGCQAPVDAWDRIYVVDCVVGTVRVVDAAARELATSREMAVAELRLLPDGRGIALARDGSILILRVTPP